MIILQKYKSDCNNHNRRSFEQLILKMIENYNFKEVLVAILKLFVPIKCKK